MKKLFLLTLVIASFSCKKSNDAPVDPPVNTAAKVTIQSAFVVNNALNLTLLFANSSAVASCQLVIYVSDAVHGNYKYNLEIQDGQQLLICPKYSDVSPMMYQIKYTMKSGNVLFTDPMYQSY